jgi:hypothetical protein
MEPVFNRFTLYYVYMLKLLRMVRGIKYVPNENSIIKS